MTRVYPIDTMATHSDIPGTYFSIHTDFPFVWISMCDTINQPFIMFIPTGTALSDANHQSFCNQVHHFATAEKLCKTYNTIFPFQLPAVTNFNLRKYNNKINDYQMNLNFQNNYHSIRNYLFEYWNNRPFNILCQSHLPSQAVIPSPSLQSITSNLNKTHFNNNNNGYFNQNHNPNNGYSYSYGCSGRKSNAVATPIARTTSNNANQAAIDNNRNDSLQQPLFH